MKVKIYRGMFDQYVLVDVPKHDGTPETGHMLDEIKEHMRDYGDREMLFHDDRLGFYEARFEWDGGSDDVASYECDEWLYLTDLKYIGSKQ